MHDAGRQWLMHCRVDYPDFFQKPIRVLELGSYNENGSVREWFHPHCEFIGVDWRPGPYVEVVSLCHEIEKVNDPRLAAPFDVLVSAYTLEHDPYWELSIQTGIRKLSHNGGVFLQWGSARCRPHYWWTAPDGKFHALPAGRVLRLLDILQFEVREFWYEGNMPFVDRNKCIHDGLGEVALVASKRGVPSPVLGGTKHLDELLREDVA